MSHSKPLLPGATLGLLGGGQLGRMFTHAATAMGYRVHVFDQNSDGPSGQVAQKTFAASFDDTDALRAFARSVDAVTLEFENIPSEAVRELEAIVPLRPGAELLHLAQHRLREKEAICAAGVPTVAWLAVDDDESLANAVEVIGTPSILKTASSGYDGKGQARIESPAGAQAAFDRIGRQPAILEAMANFEFEVSVVGARGQDGAIALFEPAVNGHQNHILDVSVTPAGLSPAARKAALEIARQLLEAWSVVGVMCVEMFSMPDGKLLVNEVAPRPHNSGHWSIEACRSSQFEQQVRTLCALPLGSSELVAPAATANIMGDLWTDGPPNWDHVLRHPLSLHLYGKGEARPGRKMGHLTALAETTAEARDLVLRARREAVATIGGRHP